MQWQVYVFEISAMMYKKIILFLPKGLWQEQLLPTVCNLDTERWHPREDYSMLPAHNQEDGLVTLIFRPKHMVWLVLGPEGCCHLHGFKQLFRPRPVYKTATFPCWHCPCRSNCMAHYETPQGIYRYSPQCTKLADYIHGLWTCRCFSSKMFFFVYGVALKRPSRQIKFA